MGLGEEVCCFKNAEKSLDMVMESRVELNVSNVCVFVCFLNSFNDPGASSPSAGSPVVMICA